MASSKVMASSSPANQDLQRHHQTTFDHNNTNLISMNMDDLLKNMYEDSRHSPENLLADDGGGGRTTMDHEGWKDPEMTLEDFLSKARGGGGAVREEDVAKLKLPPVSSSALPAVVVSEYSGVIDPIISGAVAGASFQSIPQKHMQFRNAIGAGAGSSGGGGRGKRKVMVEDPPVDKATQQKQRRMIKNRESAARSRERKQAYTVELESLVTQLEEEHARLLKEVDELNKERFKQVGLLHTMN
ncbi:hypothetical protein OSB04_006536 [Centaurea solstitialis]|uniref:BZIP domain-containing protein n=1 Tax=Centaurea solstitialis TaxID=347529 RepID=A0AA38TVX0_9ASTR|nr:hypothetical protein OSB04_006536 [Centaurea solstitialis]